MFEAAKTLVMVLVIGALMAMTCIGLSGVFVYGLTTINNNLYGRSRTRRRRRRIWRMVRLLILILGCGLLFFFILYFLLEDASQAALGRLIGVK